MKKLHAYNDRYLGGIMASIIFYLQEQRQGENGEKS
jgi:hypothetical protein